VAIEDVLDMRTVRGARFFSDMLLVQESGRASGEVEKAMPVSDIIVQELKQAP